MGAAKLQLPWGEGTVVERLLAAWHGSGVTRTLVVVGPYDRALADLVSSGVCPAVVLLSYGEFGAWYLPGAILLVAAGAVRLAHYNLHGMADEATYQGLAIDNNILVLSLLFLFEGSFERDTFAKVLYGTIVVLATLGVSSLRTPKFVGRSYYVFAVLVLGLTGVYASRLLA